jgi:uncharacterized protein YerC
MLVKEILEQNKDKIINDYVNLEKSTCEIGRELQVSNASVYVFLRDVCLVEMRQNMDYESLHEQIQKMNDEGKSAYAISKELGIASSTMTRLFKKWGLKSGQLKQRKNPLNKHTAEIIKKYQNGMGSFTLAKIYDCADSSIIRLLQDNNIDTKFTRKYELNEDLFNNIDTPEKAYILGIFASDGNNTGNTLRLSMTDEDIITKVKDYICPELEIKIIPPRKKHHLTQYKLQICSTKMCNDFTKHGIMPNKTFKIDFPEQLNEDLLSHYLRGLLDGDGWISHSIDKGGYHKWFIGYCGNRPLLEKINDYLMKEFGFNFSVIKPGDKIDDRICTLSCGTIEKIRLFLEYIYKDSTIHMDRKFKKYQEFLEHIRGL